MRTTARAIAVALAAGACFASGTASAFDSGSTGADGAFDPTVNTTVPLPPSGILNYTSVNIPAGVTVTYQKNTTNTPVVILASGNVTVAGTISLNGSTASNSGAAGDGNLGEDGLPGVGGPGGFDGGRGGPGGTGVPTRRAGDGLGPGGGGGGNNFNFNCGPFAIGGAGGGFGVASLAPFGQPDIFCQPPQTIVTGGAYGSSALLPLIGGSGGGGGGGGTTFSGTGGGGGGGAILIAASGTVNVTGNILANGGASGATAGVGLGATGGGGSGGAIRIVATTISGNGILSAIQGNASISPGGSQSGSNGAVGRIRLESEIYQRTTASTPGHVFLTPPGPVFVAGTPTLTIASVAGIGAPASPTGNADITLPSTTPNPVSVVFATTGVPVGNTVQLTVIPANGAKVTAITPALTGSTASATASVSVTLPSGPSVLQAQTTYTVTAALGDLLKNFAGNERVERVTLTATLGGPQKVMLTTVSGREFEAPAEVLRLAALGG